MSVKEAKKELIRAEKSFKNYLKEQGINLDIEERS